MTTTTQIHVTKIENHSVYGHDLSKCDETGCAAGADRFLNGVDPESVVRGNVYEIDESGVVLAEIDG